MLARRGGAHPDPVDPSAPLTAFTTDRQDAHGFLEWMTRKVRWGAMWELTVQRFLVRDRRIQAPIGLVALLLAWTLPGCEPSQTANVAPGLAPTPRCETAPCRFGQYRITFERGDTIGFEDGAGAELSEEGCPPLHWRRTTLHETQGNAFDVTSVLLYVGWSRAAVESAAASLPSSEGTGLPAGVAVVVLSEVVSGMPGFGPMHGEAPPAEEEVQACDVVELDACGGRIGYVCRGSEVQRLSSAGSADDLFILELEFGGDEAGWTQTTDQRGEPAK